MIGVYFRISGNNKRISAAVYFGENSNLIMIGDTVNLEHKDYIVTNKVWSSYYDEDKHKYQRSLIIEITANIFKE